MRRLATVRVRVTLAAVMVVAVALAAGGAWVVNAHRLSLINGVDTAARLRARDVATAIVRGKNNTTGVGLVEIYDVQQ